MTNDRTNLHLRSVAHRSVALCGVELDPDDDNVADDDAIEIVTCPGCVDAWKDWRDFGLAINDPPDIEVWETGR